MRQARASWIDVCVAGVPTNVTLPVGTVFYRVHQSRHPADSFSPVLSHRYYEGGRFDATADESYPYTYMGSSVDVAVSETLWSACHRCVSGTG